jgi:hypothetical protein
MTLEYTQTLGFEIMPKESLKIKISLKESRDFKIRMWMMKQVTRCYFLIMGVLSKGRTAGVMEV